MSNNSTTQSGDNQIASTDTPPAGISKVVDIPKGRMKSIVSRIKDILTHTYDLDKDAIPERRKVLGGLLNAITTFSASPQTANKIVGEIIKTSVPAESRLDFITTVVDTPAGYVGLTNTSRALGEFQAILKSESNIEKLNSSNPDDIIRMIWALLQDQDYIGRLELDIISQNDQTGETISQRERYEKLVNDSSTLIISQTNWEAFGDFSSINIEAVKMLLPFAPEKYLQIIINSQEGITLNDLGKLSSVYKEIKLPRDITGKLSESKKSDGNNNSSINSKTIWNCTNIFPHESNQILLLEYMQKAKLFYPHVLLKIFIESNGNATNKTAQIFKEKTNSHFYCTSKYINDLFATMMQLEQEGLSLEFIITKLHEKGVHLPGGTGNILSCSEGDKDMFKLDNLISFIESYEALQLYNSENLLDSRVSG